MYPWARALDYHVMHRKFEETDVAEIEPITQRVTFVLPQSNRSGGVRVTMEMGRRLIERGYDVRIVCGRMRHDLKTRVARTLARQLRRLQGKRHDDWLADYPGAVEHFEQLDELYYKANEVVIAVGSMVVPMVKQLQADVIKVRFNHGLHGFRTEQMDAAWREPMLTFTVASTLVPRLREYDSESPIWLVPNGIHRSDYFDTHATRDGIGTIYSRNPAKNPQDILKVLSQLQQQLPQTPRYVFGEGRRPGGLAAGPYHQLPSLAEVRELYSRSRIWLLMSCEEGLPGPVLEAMACGAVVVSTNNTGSCEIIRDGENGLLFPIGDVDACLQQVQKLWDDDALRQRLATAAQRTVDHFSWDRAVAAMEQALGDVAQGCVDHALDAGRGLS